MTVTNRDGGRAHWEEASEEPARQELHGGKHTRVCAHAHAHVHGTGQEEDGNPKRLQEREVEADRAVGIQGTRHVDTHAQQVPPRSSQSRGKIQ